MDDAADKSPCVEAKLDELRFPLSLRVGRSRRGRCKCVGARGSWCGAAARSGRLRVSGTVNASLLTSRRVDALRFACGQFHGFPARSGERTEATRWQMRQTQP